MERDGTIFKDTLAIVGVIFAGLHLLAGKADAVVGAFHGKGCLVVCLACIAAYLFFCKTRVMRRNEFSYLLVLFATIVSACSLFFNRMPNPSFFGIRVQLSVLFIFTYFVVMQNDRGRKSQFAEHVFMTLLFSVVLAMCSDIRGLFLFTSFAFIYGLNNSGSSILKIALFQLMVMLVCMMIVFGSETLTSAASEQFTISSSVIALRKEGAFTSAMATHAPIGFYEQHFFETFGVTGTVFACVVFCIMAFCYVRDSGSLSFFIYLTFVLCLITIISVSGANVVDFPLLPKEPFSLVLVSMLLAYMGNSARTQKDF